MYKEKYIKYKIKYFNLKSQLGGMPITYKTHIALAPVPVHVLKVNIAPDRTQKKDSIVPLRTQIKEAVEAVEAAALQTVANETTEAIISDVLTKITEAGK